MRELIHVLLLAFADYRHERLLSFCAIFGLAAVLAPLLILYGVKFGVLNTLTERMLSDPNTLEITPVVSGRYTKHDVHRLSELSGVAFVLPRTRSIAATMNLSVQGKPHLVVSLEPTASGDPLLERYKLPSVTMVEQTLSANPESGEAAKPANPLLVKRPQANDPSLREAGAILSDMAARKLNVRVGDVLLGIVERAYGGVVSSAYVRLYTAYSPWLPSRRRLPTSPWSLWKPARTFATAGPVRNLGQRMAGAASQGPRFPGSTRAFACTRRS